MPAQPPHRAPTLDRYIIQLATDKTQAHRLLVRLAQSILRPAVRELSFLDALPDLEAAAKDQEASLNLAASVAGATAESVVSTVTAEAYNIGLAHTAGSSGKDPDASDTINPQTLQRFLLLPKYRNFVSAVAALDTTTSLGRRMVLMEEGNSGCAIVLRVLVTGAASVSKKHESLGILSDCRVDLPLLFG